MNMLRQKDSVQVKGRLDRFRDLINIDDVVEGWDKCLEGTAFNQAFNLGTGRKTTFEALIRGIAEVMGKGDRLEIEELAGTPGDMQGCIADLTRIRREIGYEPAVSLDDGLRTMWAWVQSGGRL
jgi:nucleoside-diphosphate-sugar epimerase